MKRLIFILLFISSSMFSQSYLSDPDFESLDSIPDFKYDTVKDEWVFEAGQVSRCLGHFYPTYPIWDSVRAPCYLPGWYQPTYGTFRLLSYMVYKRLLSHKI